MEMEIGCLRKKGEKNEYFFKFKESSVVLDKILDCQRSLLNKTGLGYKKDKEKYEDDTWSPKNPEASLSTSKVAPHAPAHENKEFGSSKLQQGISPIPQIKLRKETTQNPKYESGLNGYCYFCSNFGHKAMECRLYGREVMEGPMTQLDVGHVADTCHTLRCYTCSGFGHKSQECASKRSQPRSSAS